MKEHDLVLGMDIGGTRTKYGLIDLQRRKLTAQRVAPTQTSGQEAFIQTTIDVIGDLCRETGISRGEIRAGGLGIPGYVDGDQISMVWESLSYMEGGGFRRGLAERLGFPIRMDNDARVVALGEDHFGDYFPSINQEGGKSQRLLSLTLGTGLGVALVVNGKLLESGSINHLAGHIPIRPGAAACFCGFSGCLESLVSASALVRNYQVACGLEPTQPGRTPANVQEILLAARSGEAQATQAVQHLCEDLVTGLNAYIYLYGPDVIVIGGGVAIGLAPWLPYIARGLFARPYSSYRVNVFISSLREEAGLYGAASLWDELTG